MNYKLITAFVAVAGFSSIAMSSETAGEESQIPLGWSTYSIVDGEKEKDFSVGTYYRIGVDNQNYDTPPTSYVIESIKPTNLDRRDNAQLYQSIDTDEYLGKYIVFTFKTKFIPHENGSGSGVFWVNLKNEEGYTKRANCPEESADWYDCKIIFHVPEDSTKIIFGAELFGMGSYWLDSLRIEKSESEPTEVGVYKTIKPVNLP